MMYTVEIRSYCKSDKEATTEYLFVPANSYGEALEAVKDYYGEEDIEEITIGIFSPENFLKFESDSSDLFHEVKHRLESQVIW